MGENGELFPSFFYSKGPLPESVNFIKPSNDHKNKLYWMLSVDNESPNGGIRGQNQFQLASYDDNEGDTIDCCDLDDSFEINPTKSGKYITSFYVPSVLHATIIGPKGSKLHELQQNTNTLIKVPKPNEEALVKITGPSERNVASARTQIALLLLSKREKLSITHFVSIPMYSDSIKTNYAKFKDAILKGPATRGIDETIFQKPEKFHLTIVTVALLDEKEVNDAKQVLLNCQSMIQGIFRNNKPKIVLKGVEIMNDDPADVDVLYGKVLIESPDGINLLQQAADNISALFHKANLVRKQYENVKLHVTLMNSSFRKNDGFQHANKDKGSTRESFDATYVLQEYRDYYFGERTLEKIHLSVRFTTGQHGYYHSAVTIAV